MKRTAFIMAACLPVAVLAQGERTVVSSEALQRSTPASALLEEDVISEDGREVGEVEDIVVTRGGELRLFLVDVEGSDPGDEEGEDDVAPGSGQETGEFGARVGADADWTAKGGELDQAAVNRGDIEWGEDLVPFSPGDVRYDASGDKLVVRAGAGTRDVPREEESRLLRVSEIIGMEVNLANEESFGSVEDVMLNRERSQAVAILVDNWDGFDKQRRALPVDNAVIMHEEEEVVYPYTREQVEAIGEFDLDEHSDNGWGEN